MACEVLVCVATEFEGALLRPRVADRRDIAVLRTGVGPVNAAHAVTLFLATNDTRSILVCGVGGAYPSSGLQLGDVVCAESECYGDLGATTPDGFLDMRALGFPVVEGPPPMFNEMPLQILPIPRRARFVTVSSCTGTASAAHSLESRTRGEVESMEGAAIVHVAHLHKVPVGEIRGISNIVTNRDKSTWRLQESAAAAQEATLAWIAQR